MSREIKLPHIAVVAHGLSEVLIAKHFKSSLRLQMAIFSRDNGNTSIQITSLLDELSSKKYSKPEFIKQTNAIQFKRWEKRGVRPEDMDFRIYTLMDTDDCSDEMLARYKSGKMFHDLWLAPFIVPIWCTPNTDGVFYRAKLIPQIKSDRDKVPTYKKYFPIVKDGSLGIGEAEQICSALKGRRDTNISIFIDDCISRAKHALINPNQLHKN